jgi:hypothetical protein
VEFPVLSPDPIPAPNDDAALIVPPTIVTFCTSDVPFTTASPEPTAAPRFPTAVTDPSKIMSSPTIDDEKATPRPDPIAARPFDPIASKAPPAIVTRLTVELPDPEPMPVAE